MKPDRAVAFGILGVSDGASAEAVRAAYEQRKIRVEARVEAAPTEGLKEKYRAELRRLREARDLLLNPPEAPPSPLSASRLHDLPLGEPDYEADAYRDLERPSNSVPAPPGPALEQRRRQATAGLALVAACALAGTFPLWREPAVDLLRRMGADWGETRALSLLDTEVVNEAEKWANERYKGETIGGYHSYADEEELRERFEAHAEERREAWRQTAEAGVPEAQWLLGEAFRAEATTTSFRWVAREAFPWQEEAPNPRSLFGQAEELFGKAAAQQYNPALFALGMMLYHNSEDDEWAMHIRAAADRGFVPARKILEEQEQAQQEISEAKREADEALRAWEKADAFVDDPSLKKHLNIWPAVQEVLNEPELHDSTFDEVQSLPKDAETFLKSGKYFDALSALNAAAQVLSTRTREIEEMAQENKSLAESALSNTSEHLSEPRRELSERLLEAANAAFAGGRFREAKIRYRQAVVALIRDTH